VATPTPFSGTKSGPRVIEPPATVTPAPSARRTRPPQLARTPPPDPNQTRIVAVEPPKTVMMPADSPNSLAPLPAPTRIEPRSTELERPPELGEQPPAPRSSRAPIFLLVGLFLVGGVATFAVLALQPKQGSQAPPLPPHEVKADAPKADAPKADAPKSDAPKSDAPKSDAKVPSPKPEKSPEPKKERPRASAPSTAELTTRIHSLETRLEAKEAKAGSKDRVLRQFLEQAKTDLSNAKTDEQRRDLSRFLTEFDKQIGP
jgi:hypothetical protein